ncbi:MAG: hypothetical protein DRP78_05310, partial [Candidatus Omnitrophota bacterium]
MQKIITYNFSENYIKKLCLFISKQYLVKNKDISRLAFVFGGKRPGLFLKKHLSILIKKSFYPPSFFSIEEFFTYLVSENKPLSKISDLDACYIIYNLAKNVSRDIIKGKENFSQFLPWAREILHCIELFDLNLINTDCLQDIQLNAEIGYDIPDNINTLLKHIVILRKQFHCYLEENNIYSKGLIYLKALEIVNAKNLPEFEQIFFCNLFYLHKTEEKIIRSLYDQDKAWLVFQGDQENWPILKDFAQRNSFLIKSKEIKPDNYNLRMYAGFDLHSQVSMIREILKKIKNPEKSVIVLPDTSAVIALLSEITAVTHLFNISMGYPVKRSSLYALFMSLFKVQVTKKDGQYYVKDYLNLLSHPFIKNLKIAEHSAITRVIVHKIEEVLLGMAKTSLSGSLFINLEDIENLELLFKMALETLHSMNIHIRQEQLKQTLKLLHKLLFYNWEQTNNFYEYSKQVEILLNNLLEKSFLNQYPLNLKIANKVFAIKDELKNSVFKHEKISLIEMFKIFENKFARELISFSGTPLKGLQVLGLFETRGLSFENVIIMDVNESVLPNLTKTEPLIPMEVMLQLGINNIEKEEVQRYHFMRLIASAKNVHLIYDGSEKKRKSRFIEEIIWQKQKNLKALTVEPVMQANFKVKFMPKTTVVPKTASIINFLKRFSYSASSIDTYLHCPLRFYYKYVLRLREKKDFSHKDESADIGNVIHDLLEQAYKKFIGTQVIIDDEFKKYFFKLMDSRFEQNFSKKMPADSFLLKKIFIFRLNNFLRNEAQRAKEEISTIMSL